MTSVSTQKLKAIFWILLCKSTFIGMMSIAKYLPYPALESTYIRSIFVLLLTTGLLVTFPKKISFKRKNLPFHIIRVISGAFAMMCFFYAYDHLPLSKASTIIFTHALILPIFGALFLKEHIGPHRIVAIIIGYLGVFIAIDPIFEVFEFGEFIALLGASLMAITSICVRKLTSSESSLQLMFYSAFTMVVFLTVYFFILHPVFNLEQFGFKKFIPLEFKDFSAILFLFFFAFVTQFSFIHAYKFSKVSFLAPFDYSKLVFAIVIDYLMFSKMPSLQTIIGACVIIISTLYITRKEMKI